MIQRAFREDRALCGPKTQLRSRCAGDGPLLAQHQTHSLLGQEQRRACADDPAADDTDIGARGSTS